MSTVSAEDPPAAPSPPAATPSGAPTAPWARPPLGRHTLLILFVLANLILLADPLIPQLFFTARARTTRCGTASAGRC